MNIRLIRQLVIASLLAICGCTRPSTGPALTISTPVMDLGQIPSEGTSARIAIRNSGDQTLLISRIGKSCNCAVVEGPKELAVGESGTITVAIPPTIGTRSIRLLVNTNAAASISEVLLTWHGDSPPTLDPPKLVFDDVGIGATVSRAIRISYAGGDLQFEPVLKRTVFSSSSIRAERGKSDPASRATSRPPENRREVLGTTEYVVSYKAPDDPGTYHESCRFVLTSTAGDVELVLPIECHVVGSLSSRGSVVFSAKEAQDLLSIRRTIKVDSSIHSKALPTVVAPDCVKCVISETSVESSASAAYELTVSLLSIPKDRIYRSNIRVSNSNDYVDIPLLVVASGEKMK